MSRTTEINAAFAAYQAAWDDINANQTEIQNLLERMTNLRFQALDCHRLGERAEAADLEAELASTETEFNRRIALADTLRERASAQLDAALALA